MCKIMRILANLMRKIYDSMDIHVFGSEDERRKKTLNLILIGVTFISIPTFSLIMIVGYISNVAHSEIVYLHQSFALFLASMFLLYQLNKKLSGFITSSIFLIFFNSLIVITDTVFEVSRGRGLFLFSIPIMLSSLLIYPWSSFLMAGVTGILVYVLSLSIDLIPDVGAISSFFVLATVSWLMARSQKKAIESLHLVNVLISKRVEERTKELINANTRLQALSEMKTRFVSTATHELRTPLTSMKGYLELVRDEDLSPLVEDYLVIVDRNMDRLVVLTEDLLDQQRIDEHRLDLIPASFDLNQLMHNVVEELQTLADKTNQKILVDIPSHTISVVGDRSRIHQVTSNLLDNALKYSPEGSTVRIAVKTDNIFVEVSVEDTGIGLDHEDLAELFKPFPNIERPVLTRQSVGLGLSISKGLIELHGGRIWAESKGKGEGSVFKFTLPL